MREDGACAVTRSREETLRMLSIPDMAILGTAALLFFGPDQLPKVARKVGLFMRDVQNTSQSFIREMERAADEPEPGAPDPAVHDYSEPYVPAPASNGTTRENLPGASEPYVDPWWTRISERTPVENPEPPPPPSGGYQLPP